MSDIDDLEEVATQMSPRFNNSRATKRMRDAQKRALSNSIEAKRSKRAQEQRALDRRRPQGEVAEIPNQD
jgi:hypothetical protein